MFDIGMGPEGQEEQDIYLGIINRFVGLHSREAMRATRNEAGREYPFVAMDPRQVYAQLRFVGRHLELVPEQLQVQKSPRLLDVGCGIGNVLLFAEQFGFEVYGIEKDEYPFQIACRLFGKERVRQADIWSYDQYGNFDVIYYFRPFSDREPQRRFERLIEDQLRPGGILIANHKSGDAIEHDPRFERLASHLPVWQKKVARSP